ncbi:MAG: hypothetical protein M0030_04560 [Actinomycetota bacterium]|nr:hypothetical protein [Actinomycetota bacterium]
MKFDEPTGELRPEEVRRREAERKRRAARTRGIVTAGASPSVPGKNYQPVILAEFTAAMLLTAITPIARKQRNTATGGLSPYEGRDMVQLISLLIVYLILAFISAGSGRAARFSAWFGGLVALTVGLAGASEIASVFNVLAGGTVGVTQPQAKKAAKASSSGGGGGKKGK